MHKINKDRLISTFLDLVSISSPSWKEHSVMDYIEKRLSKLGIGFRELPCGGSFNLLADMQGTTPQQAILLSGHMDTVGPCDKISPVVTETRITSDGTSILGSDDKAAIAMFLEAFEVIREKNIPHGNVEMLLTCAEEVGLQGIKQFDMSLLKSRLGFVLDSGGPVGTMIMKAPYQYSMEIRVKGKAAHAGMEPEKGISAIVVLAAIISQLPNGRLDEETTINVGIISGGKATNIVAEESYCKLEMRSIDQKKIKSLEAGVRETAKEVARSFGAKVHINRAVEYPGFTLKDTAPVVRLAERAMRSIRLNPKHIISGGGSDTNIFNKSGIHAINLSCGMQNVHTTGEFIMTKDLVKGAELVLALIEEA